MTELFPEIGEGSRGGTQHEQDSIKNRTRQLEKFRHIEETFLYFNPTEK